MSAKVPEGLKMKVLVINAGSSSIKYQLIDMTNEHVMAKGMCDRIGIEGGNFKHKVEGREDYKIASSWFAIRMSIL